MKHPWSLVVVAMALFAGACSNDETTAGGLPIDEHLASYDYRLRYPLIVEPRIAALNVSTADGTVSANDRHRLEGFASQFLNRRGDVVEISVGAPTGEDPTARGYAQAVAGVLLDAGLRASELRMQLVLDDPSIPPGTALLRFNTTMVQIPECNDWREGDHNGLNHHYACAVQHNIGEMMANPRDLVEARPVDHGQGSRGVDMIDKSNQGQATWSAPLPWGASPQGGK